MKTFIVIAGRTLCFLKKLYMAISLLRVDNLKFSFLLIYGVRKININAIAIIFFIILLVCLQLL
jgi:hypothetical protein